MNPLDFTDLPYWDLCAVPRPVSIVSTFGLDAAAEQRFRARLRLFIDQAFEKLSAGQRPPVAGTAVQAAGRPARAPAMLNLDALPRPSAKRIALYVTPAAERALRSGHPWVFDQAIRSQSHTGQPGDLAVIFDARRRFLAIGLYDPRSPIRVRVLQHHTPAAIDRAWFTERLRAAANIREPLPATGTDGYRLVHGENDGLPGLVVDRYAGTLVLKLYTAAWLPHLADILAALADVQPASASCCATAATSTRSWRRTASPMAKC